MNQNKLLLLHGPGLINSRKKLVDIKSKYSPEDITTFSGNFRVEDLMGNISTVSLFSSDRLVVVENPSDALADLSLDLPDGVTLVFWSDHEISSTKPILKLIKEQKGEALLFPASKETSVFPLLDALGNKDKSAFVLLEQLKIEKVDFQYIVTMILYLLRTLVSPNDKAPAFVKSKLQKQQQNFNKEKVTEIYKFVLETDFKLKSGLVEKDQAEFQVLQKFVM